MPRRLLGQGNVLTAWENTMVAGSPQEPWIVWKSDDAGIWPIEQHRTKAAAQKSAKYWNGLEDQRHQTWNSTTRKPLPRHCFDDYYVRRYDE